jgi:hypothetical protein
MHVGRLTYLISPSARKRLRWKLLFVLGVICLPLLSTGCICLSFGGWGHDSGEQCESKHHDSDGAVTQKGSLTFGNGEPVTVYYPVPFASPPNLEIRDQFNKCRIIDQRADCFRIVQDGPSVPSVHWTARGITTPASTPSVTPVVITTPGQSNEPQPVVPTGFSR